MFGNRNAALFRAKNSLFKTLIAVKFCVKEVKNGSKNEGC